MPKEYAPGESSYWKVMNCVSGSFISSSAREGSENTLVNGKRSSWSGQITILRDFFLNFYSVTPRWSSGVWVTVKNSRPNPICLAPREIYSRNRGIILIWEPIIDEIRSTRGSNRAINNRSLYTLRQVNQASLLLSQLKSIRFVTNRKRMTNRSSWAVVGCLSVRSFVTRASS